MIGIGWNPASIYKCAEQRACRSSVIWKVFWQALLTDLFLFHRYTAQNVRDIIVTSTFSGRTWSALQPWQVNLIWSSGNVLTDMSKCSTRQYYLHNSLLSDRKLHAKFQRRLIREDFYAFLQLCHPHCCIPQRSVSSSLRKHPVNLVSWCLNVSSMMKKKLKRPVLIIPNFWCGVYLNWY